MTASRSIAFATLVTVAAWPFAASAVDLPLRKQGLWQLTMDAQAGMPTTTMQQCTDASTDNLLNTAASPVAADTCSQNDVSQTSSGYATDSVCTFSGRTSTTHSDIAGDFNSSYTVSVTSRLTDLSTPSTTMNIAANWVSACTSDQRPGDVMLPDGSKINVVDLNAARTQAR